MTNTTITVTTEIDLDIKTAAKWFAHLSDDEQCRFLVAVAEEAKAYPSNPDNQWYYLGGHLKSCSCSTEEAREMVRRWVYWIDHSSHS